MHSGQSVELKSLSSIPTPILVSSKQKEKWLDILTQYHQKKQTFLGSTQIIRDLDALFKKEEGTVDDILNLIKTYQWTPDRLSATDAAVAETALMVSFSSPYPILNIHKNQGLCRIKYFLSEPSSRTLISTNLATTLRFIPEIPETNIPLFTNLLNKFQERGLFHPTIIEKIVNLGESPPHTEGIKLYQYSF